MATPLTERNLAICADCFDCIKGRTCRLIWRNPPKGKIIFKIAEPIGKEYWQKWYQCNRENHNRKNILRYRENPDKGRANHIANNKKYLFEDVGVCENCGFGGFLEKHHPDYSPGKELEVIFLCRSCHRKLHRKGLPGFNK